MVHYKNEEGGRLGKHIGLKRGRRSSCKFFTSLATADQQAPGETPSLYTGEKSEKAGKRSLNKP